MSQEEPIQNIFIVTGDRSYEYRGNVAGISLEDERITELYESLIKSEGIKSVDEFIKGLEEIGIHFGREL